MTDVVLIFMLPKFNYNIKFQPQGVLHLASALEKEGIGVKILDMNVDFWSKEKTLKFLLKEDPKVVGIGAMSNQTRDAVNFASYFKENGLDSKIVLGGPHVTLCPDFVKKFKMFDYGFVGEGEITFPRMVKNIMKGNSPKKKIIRGKRPENLDKLPLPAYHLLDMKKYRLPHTSMRFCTAMTSRGCPYNCKFCNAPMLSGQKVRFKSIDKVMEEIKILNEEFKVGNILFTDENFTFNERRVTEICQRIIKEKIDIKWLCETRVDLVNNKLLKLMHKAGCRTIGFGVESGSEKIRNKVKGTPPSDKVVERAFNLCDKIGIKSAAFLILGHPDDTREDIIKTLEYPLKLNADFIYPNPSFILPSTSTFKTAVRRGLIEKNEWDRYASGEISHAPIFKPNGMSVEEIMRMIIKLDAIFYLRPYTIARRLKKIKNFDDFATLVRASRDIVIHTLKADFFVKRFFYTYLSKPKNQ